MFPIYFARLRWNVCHWPIINRHAGRSQAGPKGPNPARIVLDKKKCHLRLCAIPTEKWWCQPVRGHKSKPYNTFLRQILFNWKIDFWASGSCNLPFRYHHLRPSVPFWQRKVIEMFAFLFSSDCFTIVPTHLAVQAPFGLPLETGS